MGCCGDSDCRVIPARAVASTVRPAEGGWFIVNTGETIPYTDERIHKSPDGEWRICQGPDPARPNRTYCLFPPPFTG